MTILKKRLQLITVLLICLILFQSCRVYHHDNVSLDKAINEQKRVKIHTKDGQKLKFKKIVLDSSIVYGIQKVRGKIVKTPLDIENIDRIRLHNKTMSIIYGTGIGIVVALVGSAVLFFATWDGPDFNFETFQLPQ